jgi:hypothetical protein
MKRSELKDKRQQPKVGLRLLALHAIAIALSATVLTVGVRGSGYRVNSVGHGNRALVERRDRLARASRTAIQISPAWLRAAPGSRCEPSPKALNSSYNSEMNHCPWSVWCGEWHNCLAYQVPRGEPCCDCICIDDNCCEQYPGHWSCDCDHPPPCEG